MSSINYSEESKYLFKCFVILFRSGIKQEYYCGEVKQEYYCGEASNANGVASGINSVTSNVNGDTSGINGVASGEQEKTVTNNGAKIFEKMDFDGLKALYALAKRHAVVSIVYDALKKNNVFQNVINQLSNGNDVSQLMKKWDEASNQAITKEILFDNELDKIKTAFSDEQIYSVPLKGIVIKKLYPRSGMRQFCDYDVLIRPNDANKVKAIMKTLGYSVSNETKAEEEVHQAVSVIDCKKMPIFNFEIHKKLFWGNNEGYFSKIWDRVLLPSNNFVLTKLTDSKSINDELQLTDSKSINQNTNFYEGKLTDEDVYLFHLAHFNSHLNERSGAGIRYLADHYLLKKFICSKPNFNRKYVEGVLINENISEFEQRINSITDNLFDAPTEEIRIDDLYDFLANGVHGSVENKVKMNVSKDGKFKFFIKRAFPPYNDMCIYFSILKKMPFLLPFCWIARFFIVLFDKKRRTTAKTEIRQLR